MWPFVTPFSSKKDKYFPITHQLFFSWTGRDLNPWPLPCEGSDLPTDLPAPKEKVKRVEYMSVSHLFKCRKL